MAKAAPARTKPAPSRSIPMDDASTLPPLRVSYFRRMRRQRVYAVNVSWYNRDNRRPRSGTSPVVLRLLMAGAQVVPSEQTLDPAKPDAKAAFFVTPLARGRLRNERLEVLIDGRKVQDMPLPAKVVSQRMTWALLALTFLVPAFLLHYCKYSRLQPMSGEPGFHAKGATAAAPNPMGGFKGKGFNMKGKGKPALPPQVKADAEPDTTPDAGQIAFQQDDEPAKNGKPAGQAFGQQAPGGNVPPTMKPGFRPDPNARAGSVGTGGQILEKRVADNLPVLPEFIEKNAPEFVSNGLTSVPKFAGDVYDKLYVETARWNLPYYVALTLLILTLLSALVHNEKQKRRVGKPIPLPEPAPVRRPALDVEFE